MAAPVPHPHLCRAKQARQAGGAQTSAAAAADMDLGAASQCDYFLKRDINTSMGPLELQNRCLAA